MMDFKDVDYDFEQHLSIDFDYRGMKITVYRNGEEYDTGHAVVISRRQFRHWIKFLDYLSIRLCMGAAVHRIYTMDGIEIHKFDELEANGSYVAVTHGPFIQLEYGTKKGDDKDKLKRWNYDPKIEKKECGSLDSAESVEIYLKRCGYGTVTGLPFPFDAPRPGSPTANHRRTTNSKSPEPRLCQRLLPVQNSLPKSKSMWLKPTDQIPPIQAIEGPLSVNKVVGDEKPAKYLREQSLKNEGATRQPISKPYCTLITQVTSPATQLGSISNSAAVGQTTSAVIQVKDLPEKKIQPNAEVKGTLKVPEPDSGSSTTETTIGTWLPESKPPNNNCAEGPAQIDKTGKTATAATTNDESDNGLENKKSELEEKAGNNPENSLLRIPSEDKNVSIKIAEPTAEETDISNNNPLVRAADIGEAPHGNIAVFLNNNNNNCKVQETEKTVSSDLNPAKEVGVSASAAINVSNYLNVNFNNSSEKISPISAESSKPIASISTVSVINNNISAKDVLKVPDVNVVTANGKIQQDKAPLQQEGRQIQQEKEVLKVPDITATTSNDRIQRERAQMQQDRMQMEQERRQIQQELTPGQKERDVLKVPNVTAATSNDRIQRERAQMQQERREIQQELTPGQKEREVLKVPNVTVPTADGKIQQEKAQLQQDRLQMQQERAPKQQEKDNLKVPNVTATAANDRIQRERAQMQQERRQMQQERTSIQQERDVLKVPNVIPAIDNANIQQERAQLQQERMPPQQDRMQMQQERRQMQQDRRQIQQERTPLQQERAPTMATTDRMSRRGNDKTDVSGTVVVEKPDDITKNPIRDKSGVVIPQGVNTEEILEKDPKPRTLINDKANDNANGSKPAPVGKLNYKADQIYIPFLIKSVKIPLKPTSKDSSKVQFKPVRENSMSIPMTKYNTRVYTRQIGNDRQLDSSGLYGTKRTVTINLEADKLRQRSFNGIENDNEYLENQRPLPMCYDPDFGDFDFILNTN